MKALFAGLAMALSATIALAPVAEAKPLGGGKSIGMKRESIKRDTAPAAPATPPTNAAPATPAGTPPVAAPAPSGASRWLGPLAGLAAGGLLASMFMGGGAGGGMKLFDILVIAGLAFGAFMLFRMMMRGRMAPDAAGNVATSPAAMVGAPAAERVVAPEIGSKIADGNASLATIEAATAAPRVPAGFEVEPFLRQGRIAFTRLQAANDRGDTDDIRDFTTPEMYAELAMQIEERGHTPQRTDVVSLDAKLLEVVTEGNREIASVRFIAQYREAANGPIESLDEVWHVTKRIDDPKATWLLAGIQQLG